MKAPARSSDALPADPHAGPPAASLAQAGAGAPLADDTPQAAAARVRQLIESPSYRQADEDRDFLLRPEMCGVRLQLDFWKVEEILQRHRIADTVVVYGGTRLIEPAAAQRRVEAARAALAHAPTDPQCRRNLEVAERILAKSRYYTVAREFGRLVARARPANGRPPVAIVTGGGPGIMEAANRGAFEAGAPSIGLNISLPREQLPNPYLTPDLCFKLHYFAIRKLHLLERAQAAVFFPGGYGTCDELFEVLTLLQTRKIAPLPVVLVGPQYWRRVLDIEFLVDEGMIEPADAALFAYADSADEIWAHIADRFEPPAPDGCDPQPRV
jgi:uncharacterized protein (TIGR00730 family)